MFYAGIDWSDTHHDVLVIDDAGRQVKAPMLVNHTLEGLEELHLFLEAITGPGGKENMACIVEYDADLLQATQAHGTPANLGDELSDGQRRAMKLLSLKEEPVPQLSGWRLSPRWFQRTLPLPWYLPAAED